MNETDELALAFWLDGIQCSCWFDENGELCVKGPEEARRLMEAFLCRINPIMTSAKITKLINTTKLSRWVQIIFE
jgi:hypothetical protein